ncbi:MAG: hypothetical protein J5887_04950, partial [Erysipelotrichaceae bacterium]|nr:hypothetical protein [Erysipelotrichaceae bacterium]
IIDSITATVTKLDEPIIKGGYMGEATYYFEYMISVEFHVIAEEGVNCAGFSFKLLTPFGSEEREFHDDYNNTYLDGEVDFGEFIPAGEHVFIQNVYFPYVVTASKLLVTGYDDGH